MQEVKENHSHAEVPINENFASLLHGELFAYDPTLTSGTSFYYKGGKFPVNGAITTIADGYITLANGTNYIGVNQAGVVSSNLTTPSPLLAPLYTVVMASSIITSITDNRFPQALAKQTYGIASIALTSANVTLTQAQALCDSLVVTGALTAARDLIVPLVRREWKVRHTGSAFACRIIGASGTGVTIGIGKAAIVECDGTNVNRLTADA